MKVLLLLLFIPGLFITIRTAMKQYEQKNTMYYKGTILSIGLIVIIIVVIIS